MRVDVLHCPQHGFGIGVNGTRVLGPTCCPAQKVVASFPVDAATALRIRLRLTQKKPARPPRALPQHNPTKR